MPATGDERIPAWENQRHFVPVVHQHRIAHLPNEALTHVEDVIYPVSLQRDNVHKTIVS